jgi:hypothetical protein
LGALIGSGMGTCTSGRGVGVGLACAHAAVGMELAPPEPSNPTANAAMTKPIRSRLRFALNWLPPESEIPYARRSERHARE